MNCCSCCWWRTQKPPKVSPNNYQGPQVPPMILPEVETAHGTPLTSADTTPLHLSPTAFNWDNIRDRIPDTHVEEIAYLEGRHIVVLLSDDVLSIRVIAERMLQAELTILLGKGNYHLVLVNCTEEAERAISGLCFTRLIPKGLRAEEKILTIAEKVHVAILDFNTQTKKTGEKLASELREKHGLAAPFLASFTTGEHTIKPNPFDYDMEKPIKRADVKKMIQEAIAHSGNCARSG